MNPNADSDSDVETLHGQQRMSVTKQHETQSTTEPLQPHAPNQPALWTRTNTVPLMVFGFIFSYNRKLAWANKHNFCPEKPALLRTDDVLKEIARQLPPSFRRVALVHDAKSPTTCLVVCNNMSEAELAKARDPDILRVYYDAVGSERRPGWYPVTS